MKNTTKQLIKTLTDKELNECLLWYKIALKEHVGAIMPNSMSQIYENFLKETILYIHCEINARKK